MVHNSIRDLTGKLYLRNTRALFSTYTNQQGNDNTLVSLKSLLMSYFLQHQVHDDGSNHDINIKAVRLIKKS